MASFKYMVYFYFILSVLFFSVQNSAEAVLTPEAAAEVIQKVYRTYKSRRTALIIVDMQPLFFENESSMSDEARERLIDAILVQIDQAIFKREKIVIVEYRNSLEKYGFGSTFERIAARVRCYPHVVYVIKAQNDGSKEIAERLGLDAERFEHFRFCGINTSFCVRETAEGLMDALPSVKKVSIVDDACANTFHPGLHRTALTYLSSYPRVVVETFDGGEYPRLTHLRGELPEVSRRRANLELVELLSAADPESSYFAYRLLTARNVLSDKIIVDALVHRMKERGQANRSYAVLLLGKGTNLQETLKVRPEIESDFVELLADPDADVRVAVSRVLLGSKGSTRSPLVLGLMVDRLIEAELISKSDDLPYHELLQSFKDRLTLPMEDAQLAELSQAVDEVLVKFKPAAAHLEKPPVEKFISSLPREQTALVRKVILSGNNELLRAFIESGADLRGRDFRGIDPLHYAEFERNFEAMRMILASGQIVQEEIRKEIEYLESFKKMHWLSPEAVLGVEKVIGVLREFWAS